MLRIVDMRDALEEDSCFAVWDIVSDAFIVDNFGDYVWVSRGDFRQAFVGVDNIVDRVLTILPQWVAW
jgi:hypothetical protein|tara:strand:- start:608 stop:811 length:204 start_codon:yes stop_codon:yes gene_type:complete